MNTEIFKCVAGSGLFGTTIATSDTDYKSVHIPSAKSILMGTANAVIDQSTGPKNATNTADDVDMASFPVQRYLSLLSKMETNALEMLYAPNMHDDFLWNQIKEDRFRIMTSNKKSFTGYAKGQAMRYAVRGDRLNSLMELVARLEKLDPKVRMNLQQPLVAFHGINDVRVYRKTEGNPEAYVKTPYLNACGREVPLTCYPKDALKIFSKPIEEAGKRAMNAASEGGPDWKGLYHAQRIVHEGIELFSTGEITFPCERAKIYVQIRNGEWPIDMVLDDFEDSLQELEELTPISDFRDKPDQEWINEYVSAVHEQKVVDAFDEWRESA
jgi:hypothetical protein